MSSGDGNISNGPEDGGTAESLSDLRGCFPESARAHGSPAHARINSGRQIFTFGTGVRSAGFSGPWPGVVGRARRRWRKLWVWARADEQTSQTQALLALRPSAERSLAHRVTRDLRRARYFGTAKVELQAVAIALAVNLARVGKLLWLRPELEPAWAMAG
jgi:Transposase DDE domain